MGGFMSSTPVQEVQPSPVEKVPGLQNLVQQLIQQYMQQIQGMQKMQMPYQGFQSVYGGPGGSFPGIYAQQPTPQAPTQPQPQNSGLGNLGNLSDPNNPVIAQIKAAMGFGNYGGTDMVRGGDRGQGAGSR